MKRFVFSFVFGLFFALGALAQAQTFSDVNVEYTFDLPEPVWKMTVKPSADNSNVEYVHGERSNGHLEIRKLSVRPDELMADVIRREQETKLQFLPGFVPGKEENFAGNYRGRVYNYEYVTRGRNMTGRLYFLKTTDTTVYVIRFTGLRDSLRTIRNQLDSIARTFKVKASS